MRWGVLHFDRRSIYAAIVAVGLLGPLMWYTLDRDPPYLIMAGKIEPANPKPGSTIEISWDVRPLRASCEGHKLTGSINREIVDSKGVRHSYALVNARYAAGELEINRFVQLPENLPAGPAIYHSEACYTCNPVQVLWPVCLRTPDLHFTVGGE